MVAAQKTTCPMCHSQMNPDLVVCRLCWLNTNQLQPGAYKVPMVLNTYTIDLWNRARIKRQMTKEGKP